MPGRTLQQYMCREVALVLFDEDGTETPGGKVQLWQDDRGRLEVKCVDVPSINLLEMYAGIPSPWPWLRGRIARSHEGQFVSAVAAWIEKVRGRLKQKEAHHARLQERQEGGGGSGSGGTQAEASS